MSGPANDQPPPRKAQPGQPAPPPVAAPALPPGSEQSRPGMRPDVKVAGAILRAAAVRAPWELDAADLTVAGGDTVQIVCVAEVMDWLTGLAARAEAGEAL